jgi:hypothetical protein
MTDITEKEAAKAAKEAEKEAAKAAKEAESDDFIVEDPQILRPKELPLVIKPAKGTEWANEAQAAFAATLNGYAYKNPEKWAKKKTVLLAQLKELGTNPEMIQRLQGADMNLKFSNKLVSN